MRLSLRHCVDAPSLSLRVGRVFPSAGAYIERIAIDLELVDEEITPGWMLRNGYWRSS